MFIHFNECDYNLPLIPRLKRDRKQQVKNRKIKTKAAQTTNQLDVIAGFSNGGGGKIVSDTATITGGA
jgi:hypothetical protein